MPIHWPCGSSRTKVVNARRAAARLSVESPADPKEVVYGKAAQRLGAALRQSLREEAGR